MDIVVHDDHAEQPRPERRGPSASAVERLAADRPIQPPDLTELGPAYSALVRANIEQLTAPFREIMAKGVVSEHESLITAASTFARFNVEPLFAIIRQINDWPPDWLTNRDIALLPPAAYLLPARPHVRPRSARVSAISGEEQHKLVGLVRRLLSTAPGKGVKEIPLTERQKLFPTCPEFPTKYPIAYRTVREKLQKRLYQFDVAPELYLPLGTFKRYVRTLKRRTGVGWPPY